MGSQALAASPTNLPPNLTKLHSSGFSSQNGSFCLVLANGYSSLSSRKALVSRTSVIVAAKKDKKKPDTHSFVPRPDEATGPFPEGVLLKEKKVQEDGRLLPEFADAEERELFEALNLEFESDLNVDRMRHYEVVYLIHEDHVQEVNSLNEKVQDFITENKGKIWRFSDWGLRRLAYKIQKAKHAHYILMNFELEAKCINDFKTMLDKDERVIRHLVMKRDKAETEECPPPPEFHTLRADMVDDDEDDEYDDECEVEDWDDEVESDMENYGEEAENGVMYVVDNANDEGGGRNSKITNVDRKQKKTRRAEEAVR